MILSTIESSLQQTAQDIHTLRQQIASTQAQIREFQATIDALEAQDEERLVYRQVGALMLEVDDRDSLLGILMDNMGKLTEHLGRIEAKESELRELYDELVKSIEESA